MGQEKQTRLGVRKLDWGGKVRLRWTFRLGQESQNGVGKSDWGRTFRQGQESQNGVSKSGKTFGMG